MLKPTYMAVEQVYLSADYLAGPFPCKGVTNQCAIRMSVAIQRCGITLEGFAKPERIHTGKHCDFKEPHILGAEELMDFLVMQFGRTTRYSGRELKKAYADLNAGNRRGIIYFHRLDDTKDAHIDLFDGTAIYNEIRDYPDYGNVGGAPPVDPAKRGRVTQRRYFNRAMTVDVIDLM